MIVLLLTTRNECDLLAWNIAHHLGAGIDHVAVADNRSTDDTQDVVAAFGDAASSIVFDDFHQRQTVRMQLLDRLRSRHEVTWVGVSDTDEFWFHKQATMGDLLRGTPADVVAVNFDGKLFLPTELDGTGGPVFVRRVYRTAGGDTRLHTSYTEGKTFYRSSWLREITHEHIGREVPHPLYRHPEPAVHHYMVQDEDQFVDKVARLIAWAPEPRASRVRRKAPDVRTRELPRWSSWFKKEWWEVYCRGGEEAVRQYYRDVYTLSAASVERYLSAGELVRDDAFASYARANVARPWR